MSSKEFKDLIGRISRIEKLLEDIRIWIRIGNLRQLRDMLVQELDSYEKMRIFELTDGTRSQKEIASRTKVSRSTISYYWQKWSGLGILTTSKQRKGRMKKIVTLDEVGITVRRAEVEEPEIVFQPKDLRKILSNPRMFPDFRDLESFAYNILQPPREVSSHISLEELIENIIETFEESDHMKQALFMQALERRAHEKKDTQFQRYFEAWEKHIGR